MGEEAAADMVLSPYGRAGGPSVRAARQVKVEPEIAVMRLSWAASCAMMESVGRRFGECYENDR
jgi:hypothetical protein